jgi:tetratricopeptide (TPR) repeat protein
MRTTSAVLAALLPGLLLASAIHAAPRIVFERRLPAAHDLGSAHDIALVNAATNEPLIEVFVDELVRHVDRSGTLTLRDVRSTTGPGEAHLDVKTFRCESAVRETEATRDVDGKRVKHRALQVDAICGARIEVLSRFMKPVSTFFAKGEGTSPRLEAVTQEERDHALQDAAKYAAIDAAERITPRRVRESIALDESAPAFAEGMALIDEGRFAEARAIWLRAMQTQPRSAALRFNLAAVSEALGDRRAAELHYNAARQLAPAAPRYTNEWKLFLRRGTGGAAEQ